MLKRPASIDNSDLIYDAASEDSSAGIEIHDTLLEGRDYVLLPQEVWNQLCLWWVIKWRHWNIDFHYGKNEKKLVVTGLKGGDHRSYLSGFLLLNSFFDVIHATF